MAKKELDWLKLIAWLVLALVLMKWWQNDSAQLGFNLLVLSVLSLLFAPIRVKFLGAFIYVFVALVYYFRLPVLESLSPLFSLGLVLIFGGLIFSIITVGILFYGSGDSSDISDNKLN